MELCRLNDFQVQKNDFITSDKILYLIECINNDSIKYVKTDFIKTRNGPFVMMRNWRNINTNINLNELSVLVTGHSDYPIDVSELDILNNPKLKIFICQNKNIRHHKYWDVLYENLNDRNGWTILKKK